MLQKPRKVLKFYISILGIPICGTSQNKQTCVSRALRSPCESSESWATAAAVEAASGGDASGAREAAIADPRGQGKVADSRLQAHLEAPLPGQRLPP